MTIFHITGLGAVDKLGLNHLNHKGLIKRVIGGNYGLQIPFMKNLIVSNKIEAYNFPQGILSQLCRTMAAKQPGIISKVGLKTYIDPRIEGGKMNKKTKINLVKLIKIDNEEYLFYKSPNQILQLLEEVQSMKMGMCIWTMKELQERISL